MYIRNILCSISNILVCSLEFLEVYFIGYCWFLLSLSLFPISFIYSVNTIHIKELNSPLWLKSLPIRIKLLLLHFLHFYTEQSEHICFSFEINGLKEGNIMLSFRFVSVFIFEWFCRYRRTVRLFIPFVVVDANSMYFHISIPITHI